MQSTMLVFLAMALGWLEMTSHPGWANMTFLAIQGEVVALKLMSIVLANGWKTIGTSCETKLVGYS